MRIASAIVLLATVWLLWSGHTSGVPLIFGGVAVLLVVWWMHSMDILDVEGAPYEISARLFVFVPLVVWLIIKANWDVAKVILRPTLKIEPHLIRVPVHQHSALAKVIHANTITITPGTVSLDLRDNEILVHALTKSAADEEEGHKLDKWVSWLETARLVEHAPVEVQTEESSDV